MTEAIKMAALVSTLNSPEYSQWLCARTALRLGYEGGAAAVGRSEAARGGARCALGVIAAGALADVTLWDLSALSLLPQNDPASLLAIGRPQVAYPPPAETKR